MILIDNKKLWLFNMYKKCLTWNNIMARVKKPRKKIFCHGTIRVKSLSRQTMLQWQSPVQWCVREQKAFTGWHKGHLFKLKLWSGEGYNSQIQISVYSEMFFNFTEIAFQWKKTWALAPLPLSTSSFLDSVATLRQDWVG